MVQGNPVEKHYDNYCKHYNGKKFVFTDFLRIDTGNTITKLFTKSYLIGVKANDKL